MIPYRILAIPALTLLTGAVYATSADDSYLAGYATGVLKHDLKLELPALSVSDGVVALPVIGLAASDKTKAVKLLTEIPGVKGVKLVENADDPALNQAVLSGQAIRQNPVSTASAVTLLPNGLLPDGLLFKPLLADPRWAHFSATYRNYQSDNFTGNQAASVSFGETIPFYRANLGNTNLQWETGLQAGVFSDFNLNSKSKDLVNTDFIASVYGSFRVGNFSVFSRLYHQSSHVGDEFLLGKLNTDFRRVNLSYEGLDTRISYELPYGVRIYGGGGGIADKEPSNLKTWSTQYGIEFRSPWRIDFASMRPLFAVDVKNFDENNWSTDISARAGVEFNNAKVLGRKLQILAEYFNGYTPIGQFYKDKVEYFGVGAHFHF